MSDLRFHLHLVSSFLAAASFVAVVALWAPYLTGVMRG
jgi:hypothetical protein